MRAWKQSNGRTTAAVALMLWTGCASTLNERYQTLERAWHRRAPPPQADAAAVPPFASAATLDRSALIRAVLERNPTVEARRQAWRVVLARYRQQTSYDDPMVRYEVAPLSFAGRAPFGQVVEVSQRVPFPGKLRDRGAAVLADVDAARQDYEVSRLDLALAAAQLFGRYFAVARSLEINAEHTALLADLKKSALAEYVAGRGSQQDPLQAEVEVAHVEHEDIVLRTERAVVIAQLNALLHRWPDAPLPPPPRSLAVPDLAAPAAPAKLEVAEQPELRAAAARLEGDQARIDLAHRGYFPDLTFMASYNSMWMMPEHRWMIGVSLNVPIQLGRRRAVVEEADAALARDKAERARLSDEVASGVEVARQRLIESHHVVALFRERLVPLARDQVAAARAGFTAGRNSFVAVIDAERSLRAVELNLQNALADYATADAALDRACGRIPAFEADRR